MAANVFAVVNAFDAVMDQVLSIVLITTTSGFFLYVMLGSIAAGWKLLTETDFFKTNRCMQRLFGKRLAKKAAKMAQAHEELLSVDRAVWRPLAAHARDED